MTAGVQSHWDGIYDARPDEELTWFESTPSLSYALVTRHLRPGDAFIDVGGGTSRLVDFLLKEGFGPLAVLDVSTSALAACRDRLGEHGDEVTWITADITSWQPDKPYTVWHDRAVFHFLTAPNDRAAYARTMGKRPADEGIILLTSHHARHPAAHRAVMDKLTDMLAKARAAEIGMRDTP